MFVKNSTMGFLSVYLTFSIAICYSRQYMSARNFNYGPALTALMCFCIFSGILQENFVFNVMGTQGVFTAIVSGLGASMLYCFLEKS